MTNLPNIPRLYTALAEVLAVLLYAQPLPLRLKPRATAGITALWAAPSYSVAVGNPARVIKRYDAARAKWIRVDE